MTGVQTCALPICVDHRSLEAQGIDRAPTKHLGPVATAYERRTGEPSRKRLDYRDEALERLARAREAGELERQAKATDKTILDLSGDLDAAKAERERQRAEPSPDLLKRMEQGMADFERRFETQQKIEQGMGSLEQRFAQWEAKQAQAEREKQQAAERAAQELAKQREEAERKRQAEIEPQQNSHKGPSWER